MTMRECRLVEQDNDPMEKMSLSLRYDQLEETIYKDTNFFFQTEKLSYSGMFTSARAKRAIMPW